MPRFVVYWLHGQHQEIEAETIEQAFERYGVYRALKAVDFYDLGSEVRYRWNREKKHWDLKEKYHEYFESRLKPRIT